MYSLRLFSSHLLLEAGVWGCTARPFYKILDLKEADLILSYPETIDLVCTLD